MTIIKLNNKHLEEKDNSHCLKSRCLRYYICPMVVRPSVFHPFVSLLEKIVPEQPRTAKNARNYDSIKYYTYVSLSILKL